VKSKKFFSIVNILPIIHVNRSESKRRIKDFTEGEELTTGTYEQISITEEFPINQNIKGNTNAFLTDIGFSNNKDEISNFESIDIDPEKFEIGNDDEISATEDSITDLDRNMNGKYLSALKKTISTLELAKCKTNYNDIFIQRFFTLITLALFLLN
jgi:hypothetical protein